MRVGQVFFTYCPFLSGEPKEKFLTVVCTDAPIRVALINTKNAVQVLGQAAFGPTQVYLHSSAHDFLSYDSWLDCSRLVSGDSLDLNDETLVGELSIEILEATKVAIATSPTITPRQQQRCTDAIDLEISLRTDEKS